VLPADILYRSKKGFGVPVGRWFAEGTLAIDTADHDRMMQRDAVTRRSRNHCNGRADERAFLWNAWLLQQLMAKDGKGVTQ